MTGGHAGPDHPGRPELLKDLAARIRRSGPLPFDIFMDSVLYGPEGYYQTRTGAIGRGGDYVTSTETSTEFGRALGRQVGECLERLGPGPLDIVELGAGRGTMAADILEEIETRAPELFARATYAIVERSGAMRAEQARILARHLRSGRAVWAESVDRIREGGIRGVLVANEFFDALPVKLVVRREGRVHERHVGLSEDGECLIWIDRPAADPTLDRYVARYGLVREEGSLAEAGIDAMLAAGRAARALARGYAIVIDYGDRAPALYDPALRPAGTLIGYHRHRVCENPLVLVGDQDLTAHVNVSAIEDAAADEGMTTLGWTTQGRFLIALGVADRIAALSGATDPEQVARRMAMMSLIHPEGMGERFRVLVLGKGAGRESLTGLRDPFAAPDPVQDMQTGRNRWQAPTN